MKEISRFAKYTSQKVNKIRWRPCTNNINIRTTDFATGSWNNEATSNQLCLWHVEDRSVNETNCFTEIDIDPVLQCKIAHDGDVAELVYLPNDLLLSASSNGSVTLHKNRLEAQTIEIAQKWENLHQHKGNKACPCTSVCVNRDTETFVSAGEDGRLCFVNLEKTLPVQIIEKADSCTINAVSFLKQNEVAAVNSIGQLKVWDLRESSDEPARIFLPTGDRSLLHCLDKHPTQQHIICTGGEDGALTIWDMRQDQFPVTVLQAHSADTWEVKFHPANPDHLFTCSEDGSVWHWDTSNNTGNIVSSKDFSLLPNTSTSTALNSEGAQGSYTNPWLASEASKHRMEIKDLIPNNTMPVNSLDIQETTLLCGTDGEVIYTLMNISVC